MNGIAVSPASQELVDAVVVATRYRLGPDGLPWCPEEAADALQRIIATRGRLGLLVRRALRLMRLMQLASNGAGYLVFLDVTLPALRSRHFRRLFGEAVERGRLKGVATIDKSGLQLAEKALIGEGSAFDLSFSQMPQVGAFVEIIHNMLDYDVLQSIAAPLLGPTCTADIEEVATRLDAALEEWIGARIETTHGAKIARLIAGFLGGRRVFRPDDIDDAVILDFWAEKGTQTDTDGVRLYAYAVRRMLAYRDFMVLHREAEAANDAQSFDGPLGDDVPGGISLERFEASVVEAAEWQSPLTALLETDGVEWVREYLAQLRRLLPDTRRPTEDEMEDGGAEVDASEGGLRARQRAMFHRPPNGVLFRTFARYSVFGPLQDAAKTGGEVDLPAAAYNELKACFDTLARQLGDTVGATAWVLINNGVSLGALLAAARYPEEFAEFAGAEAATFSEFVVDEGWASTELKVVQGDEADAARLAMARMIAPRNVVGSRLRAAYRNVERKGFKDEDFRDAEVVETLAGGATHVLELWRIVRMAAERLGVAVSRDGAFAADTARFAERFAAMYGARIKVAPGSGATAEPHGPAA